MNIWQRLIIVVIPAISAFVFLFLGKAPEYISIPVSLAIVGAGLFFAVGTRKH